MKQEGGSSSGQAIVVCAAGGWEPPEASASLQYLQRGLVVQTWYSGRASNLYILRNRFWWRFANGHRAKHHRDDSSPRGGWVTAVVAVRRPRTHSPVREAGGGDGEGARSALRGVRGVPRHPRDRLLIQARRQRSDPVSGACQVEPTLKRTRYVIDEHGMMVEVERAEIWYRLQAAARAWRTL